MRLEKERTKINSAIETALKNLGGMVDVNTVVGKPFKNDDGTLIIPLCKVTFGILSGGGEYGKINVFTKGADLPYSAGNGAIVSMKPCGFLVKNTDSDYKTLTFSDKGYDALLEKFANALSELTEKNKSGEANE